MHRLLTVLIPSILSLFLSAFPAQADQTTNLAVPTRLDMEELGAVQSAAATARAGLSVDPRVRQESLDFFKAVYLAGMDVEMGWTGNHDGCNAGDTSPHFRESILRRVNYFRAMAGVPADVTLSPEYNRAAQEAALMMSVNDRLSHTPGEDWVCYTVGGAEAAGRSNLFLSTYNANPIDGYIKDPGGANYVVGHRRWLLYPQTKMMGTGDVPPTAEFPATNALWVYDDHIFGARPATRDNFVAWPPPGYVPYPVVYARWSFSYPEADFSAATVSMQTDGVSVPVTVEAVEDGYGENTVVWMPQGLSDGHEWERPQNDTAYTVTIENVRIDGAPRSFAYEVIVFDPEVSTPSSTSVRLNVEVGAPGSLFTVLGADYPPGESIGIAIDGVELANVEADATGRFTAVLETNAVPTGVYKLSVSRQNAAQAAAVTPSTASTFFTLDAAAPQQLLDVPDDAPPPVRIDVSQIFEQQNLIYLPTIVR